MAAAFPGRRAVAAWRAETRAAWRAADARGRAEMLLMPLYALVFAGFFCMSTGVQRNVFYLSFPLSLYILSGRETVKLLGRNRMFFLAAALFLAYAALSCAWAVNGEDGRVFEKVKIAFFLPVSLGSLYIAFLHRPARWHTLVQWFVLGAFVTALILIPLHLQWHVLKTGRTRLHGFGRANNSVQCALLYACAVLALLLDRGVRRWPLALRVFAGLVVALAFALAEARGPALALAMVLGILLLRRAGLKITLAAGVAALAAGAGLLAVPAVRDSAFWARGDSARLAIWKQAWAKIAERPVFGHGASSKFYYPAYNEYYHNVFNASHAHSLYLSSWVMFGAAGLALFLALAGIAAWQAWRNGEAGFDRLPFAWLLFGYCVGLFDFGGYYINLSTEWVVFWFPMAAAAAFCALRQKGQEIGEGGVATLDADRGAVAGEQVPLH